MFTPKYIVNLILNEIGYYGEYIINKKIIEPSFGDGVFLIEIIDRLIKECFSLNLNKEETVKQIENNIYGIEIDKNLFDSTIYSIKNLLKMNGLSVDINLKLYNINALEYKEFNKFDFVVGNPPYIKTKNLDKYNLDLIKTFNFSKGNTDMYIVFYELGINLLNSNGKLGFITPNSFMKNTSQRSFRSYLIENNLIEKILDFKSYMVFENFLTYTAISIINKNKGDNNLIYINYDKESKDYLYSFNIDISNYPKDGIWNFSTKENYEFLNKIKEREIRLEEICDIQFGICTNRDKIYVHKIKAIEDDDKLVLFNGHKIEKDILKNIIKGSTLNDDEKMIIFPYIYNKVKNKYEIMEEEYLKENYPFAYKYLLSYKEELLKRDMEDETYWYSFARSQGLSNINKEKIIIKHIINPNLNKMSLIKADKDCFIYSGIYLTLKENIKYSLDDIYELLSLNEFYKYCLLSGKNMKGNYKYVNSKMLKKYRI